MFKWLVEILKKKNKALPLKYTCESCVYWKSEEENNISTLKYGKRYCDVYKTFTRPTHTCALYKEEYFEAKPDSVQTEEISLDLDMSIERVDKD